MQFTYRAGYNKGMMVMHCVDFSGLCGKEWRFCRAGQSAIAGMIGRAKHATNYY